MTEGKLEGRFAIDTTAMLAKCERLQWSTGEIDWEAPGADAVTDGERRALAGFMGDLYWIESIAAMVFAAMRDRTRDPVLAGIFGTFSVDEQRHADAELLLMRRWGIVARNEIPAPNLNARNLLAAIEKTAQHVHPAVFSAIIPFTELVLDGALVKHLDVTVKDPVSKEVFRKINADEARHLAVDFHVLERHGRDHSVLDNARTVAAALIHPSVLYALLLGYLPLLFRMRPNVLATGLSEEQIHACIRRYIALGDESPYAARHPTYRFFRGLSKRIVSGRREVGEFLVRLSDVCDRLDLGPN